MINSEDTSGNTQEDGKEMFHKELQMQLYQTMPQIHHKMTAEQLHHHQAAAHHKSLLLNHNED